MDSDTFMQTAHLLLGISREELKRRVSNGQIDPQLLKFQLEQNSNEIKLDSLCEKRIHLNSLEQTDKFVEGEDSSL